MSDARFTPAALKDLSAIWDSTEERWGGERAETYLREIGAAVERLAERPDRGHSCDEIRESHRRYAIGSHLVFYVERDGGIDVIRILHQRIDPTRHF